MGAQTSKLKYTGSGQFNGTDFNFSGPIDKFKVQYVLTT